MYILSFFSFVVGWGILCCGVGYSVCGVGWGGVFCVWGGVGYSVCGVGWGILCVGWGGVGYSVCGVASLHVYAWQRLSPSKGRFVVVCLMFFLHLDSSMLHYTNRVHLLFLRSDGHRRHFSV